MTEQKFKIVRKKLADGTIREFRYARGLAAPSAAAVAKTDPASLDALIRRWCGSQEWKAYGASTQYMHTLYLRPLKAMGEQPAADIELAVLLDIRDAIADARGPGAASYFVKTTQKLFKWAVQRGILKASPAVFMTRLPSGSLPAWKAADAARAIATFDEPLKRAVFLAQHTGQRRADLCALTWAAYDGQFIRLIQQKTGQEVAIPVYGELREALEAWKAEGNVVALPSAHILTSACGRPWMPANLTRAVGRALEVAGMRGDKKLNIHGLRKLKAATLAEEGWSTNEIAAITGHKTLEMVDHYTKSAERERMAVAATKRTLGKA